MKYLLFKAPTCQKRSQFSVLSSSIIYFMLNEKRSLIHLTAIIFIADTHMAGRCRCTHGGWYILETPPVCTIRVTMPERYAFQLYPSPAPKGLPHVYSNPGGTLGQGLLLKQNRSPRRSPRSHPLGCTLLVLPLCQDFDLCGAQSEISRSIKLTRDAITNS